MNVQPRRKRLANQLRSAARPMANRNSAYGEYWLPRHSEPPTRRDPGTSVVVREVSVSDDQGRTLLDNVQFKAEPGTMTCVVGSSSSDQTAFLSLLLGVEKPDSGNIQLDGVDHLVNDRNGVGLMLSEPWIRHGTIAENISFGRSEVSDENVRSAADLVGLAGFITMLPDRYNTVVGPSDSAYPTNVPTRLTNGQRRQLALARAIVTNPGLLLLEEPTTDLSAKEERLMLATLDRVRRRRTVIIGTHRLNVARKADSVIVIQNGRIVPYQPSRSASHAKLWDLRVPPIVLPDTSSNKHLRIVNHEDRRSPSPSGAAGHVGLGSEIAPGYVATALCGRTQFTDVWVAWNSEQNRPARVRISRDTKVPFHAFDTVRREALTLQAFEDPGVASVYGDDIEAELPYLALEYLDSPSLAAVVQRRAGGLDVLDVLFSGFELATTLERLHRAGFAHLGLRSHHIRTRNETIVITDVSSARSLGVELPQPLGTGNGRSGEHQSMAPEQLPGAIVAPGMDVYALGALLHRAAAGAVSTRATKAGLRLTPFANIAPHAPTAMIEAIDAMVAPSPSDRLTMAEVLDLFRRALPRSLVRPRSSELRTNSSRLRLVANEN